jgi:DNA-nicking Smr family endonuclease
MTTGRKPHLTEADRAAWAGFTRHIAPQPTSAEVPAPPPAATPSPPATPRRAVMPTVGAAATAPLVIGTPPAGVDSATWQRFRTGKLAVARELDLHGMTAQHAFQALAGFLRAAHADRLRCVEIVTGRGSRTGPPGAEGTGVIRREFPLWLNRPDIRPLVLAAAHPHAANTGAVRLLLRRAR